ncbi:MAG: iron-containing alcohol dehydrogenase [Proteobacteria bacterium]|nr:iron-containing alcohol dehydrogenase [Pseudomonadota bacterium]
MKFRFATATQIVFGQGCLAELPSLLAPLGSRALVVTGADPTPAASVLGLLSEAGIEYSLLSGSGEPTAQLTRDGAAMARAEACSFVVGVGGGSTLDAGKAIAALVTNGGDPLDYLEIVGAGRRISKPAAPYVAIPTTAGTGAEVTRNAVLTSEEHGVKASLRSDYILPRIALVDPELTYGVPAAVTASTGLDALTQNIEPFVSCRANPLTDALCRDGIRRGAHWLRRAYDDGSDAQARENMALASLFGGLALANAKLGAVHGFAAPLGGMFRAPHGALCACLLPQVMRMNIDALREREPDSGSLARYGEVARLVTGRSDATPDDGVAWAQELRDALQIPPLSAYGVTRADIAVLTEKASAASSMQGNPIKLSHAELQAILEAVL